jgi:hypothetical protein
MVACNWTMRRQDYWQERSKPLGKVNRTRVNWIGQIVRSRGREMIDSARLSRPIIFRGKRALAAKLLRAAGTNDKGGRHMGKVGTAISITARILVSLLWAAAGAVGVAAGKPQVLLVVIPYLVYLWAFRGRWLVY